MFAFIVLIDCLLMIACLVFVFESIREKEPRAPWVGAAGAGALAILIAICLWVPLLRWPAMGLMLSVVVVAGVFLTSPPQQHGSVLQGASGYRVGDFVRCDERDIVFARNRSLPPGSDAYRRYYEKHPEREAGDADRRKKGGPIGRPGAIDNGHRPNVAMILANFDMVPTFSADACQRPSAEVPPAEIAPERASHVVKGFARHLGADIVGICRVNPDWAYSHRGEIFFENWEDWGREIPEQLPYAVVIGTEMDHRCVRTGPHTPGVMESANNYARGAFITTTLARWFAKMGYKAVAHHSRHYELNMVPLAIDAGLGELGRFGYLISDRLGPRVRLFAVTCDMPLVPDKPVDLGVEEFCRRCRKCADSCPSRSIPHGEKQVINGVEKWKLDEESCFGYWAKVGTDCSVCMAVCPYSRPNRSVHRLVRWCLKRSDLARRFFPPVDNFIYGNRWKPRPAPDWLDYKK
jgi:reductive dehalogenase